jgi:hypothetical protein
MKEKICFKYRARRYNENHTKREENTGMSISSIRRQRDPNHHLLLRSFEYACADDGPGDGTSVTSSRLVCIFGTSASFENKGRAFVSKLGARVE